MEEIDIVPHLFRTEFSKLVSVITKSFGLEHIEIAEDIASETFLLALDTWPYKGIPPNPTGWLYTVAKNKIKNHLSRHKNFKTKVAETLNTDGAFNDAEVDFSDKNIADSQLQMLFTICHPSISAEAQISLALRILCGFGLDEIADAFLSNKETIHKRLQRAKKKLYAENLKITIPGSTEISKRLDTVLHTIYLLFSEGYYSQSGNSIIREELCIEALNLTYLLLNNPLTNTHASNSLMSLMSFQSSRLKARKSESGNIILYGDQDRTLWDTEFIEKGFYYLQQASQWEITSVYYIEASIAYWYTVEDTNPDKWTSTLKLYDALLSVNHSPIAALNRIWAFSKVHGNLLAIEEAQKLNLKKSHFYFVLLAELYALIDTDKAMDYLTKACQYCKSDAEKRMIHQKMGKLNRQSAG